MATPGATDVPILLNAAQSGPAPSAAPPKGETDTLTIRTRTLSEAVFEAINKNPHSAVTLAGAFSILAGMGFCSFNFLAGGVILVIGSEIHRCSGSIFPQPVAPPAMVGAQSSQMSRSVSPPSTASHDHLQERKDSAPQPTEAAKRKDE